MALQEMRGGREVVESGEPEVNEIWSRRRERINCNISGGTIKTMAAGTTSKRRRSSSTTQGGNKEGVVGESCSTGRLCWSNLPEHLLSFILMKLNVVDFYSFSQVCSAWSSAASESEEFHAASQPPLLLHTFDTWTRATKFSKKKKKEKKKFGYPGNALFCIEEGRYIHTWPSSSSSSARRLHDAHHVLGFSCGYLIAVDVDDDFRTFLAHPLTGTIVDGVKFPPFRVLATCRQSAGMLLTAPPTCPDCVLVAVDGHGGCDHSLRYCRPGWSKWLVHRITDTAADLMRPFDGFMELHPSNMAVLGGKIHVVLGDRLLVIQLLPCPTETCLPTEGLPRGFGRPLCPVLVECGGELMAVHQEHGRLTVRRFEAPARRWTPVDDLGGRAIAASSGLGGCFSWEPPPWDAARYGNRIYYRKYHLVYVFRLDHGQLELLPSLEGYHFLWVIPSLSARDSTTNCTSNQLSRRQ